jgi:hypothetical protein
LGKNPAAKILEKTSKNMNSKQIFFFSLIVLSVVMGVDWYKHRPIKPKTPQAARTAINIDEIEPIEEEDLPEDNDSPETETNPATKPEDGSEGKDSQTPKSVLLKPQSKIEELGQTDPVIASFLSLKRNPFEVSPYAKLIEQLKKKAEAEAVKVNQPKETAKVTRLNSVYSASIAIGTTLMAVIDSKTYKEGEIFNDMRIKEIKPEIVLLEKNNDKFLIPKRGVNLVISEDGSYSIEDTYLDK